MIAITHFAVGDADEAFVERAQPALAALSRCAGYQRGSLGRSTDDPAAWVLVTEWTNVGSYRRALGNYQVKLHATPLLAQARDLPSGFETLVDVAPGGETVAHASDREPLA